MLSIAGTMNGEDSIVTDTIIMSPDWTENTQKRVSDAMKMAEERLKQAKEQIQKADERLKKHGYSMPDSLLQNKDWSAQLRKLPKGWSWNDETIDLPKVPHPLIDLSNIKGRWGFEDYYFSGDILHAQFRRNGDLYVGGWNIRSLLPRLSGLLVLKSKKKAADKIAFSRGTQLRNDSRFRPIVHYKDITIYAHRTPDNLLDEVILLHASPDSPTGSRVVIVQMMGRLRPDDLTGFQQLTAPGPKTSKRK